MIRAILGVVVGMAMLAAPCVADADVFTVTGQADGTDPCTGSSCPSLRSAVLAADAVGGTNTINVPAGSYALTPPSGPDDGTTGDLHVTADTTIAGAGPGATTITGNGDRVFDISAGTVTLSGLAITGGSGNTDGGAVRDKGDAASLTLTNDSFTNNTTASGGAGGAVDMEPTATGTLTISGSVFRSNTAANTGATGGGFGGAVEFTPETSGTMTVTDSEFDSNTSQTGATSGGGFGGAIDVESGGAATVTITGSTFSLNTAAGSSSQGGFGGAIMFEPGDTGSALNLTNSTFTGNQAGGASSFGGAIMFQPGPGATGTLTNVTIAGNSTSTADRGAGIYVEDSPVTVENSIISGNTGGNCTIDLSGALTSQGHNIELGTSCGFDINADPLLAGLANNGGPTQTMALQPGSPAIDAGVTLASVATDQRGGPRPQPAGGNYDLGAFELGALADMAISKSGSPNPASVGGTLTYTLAVKNTGATPDPAFNVIATDALPAGVTVNSVAASQGSCTSSAGTVTCKLGTIVSGGSATVTIAVTPNSAGTITNTATVSSDAKDVDPSSNSASVSSEVRGAGPPPPPPPHRSPPSNITRPVISGTPNLGSKLTCSDGKWTNDPTRFAYSWNRNRKHLPGATSHRYQVGPGDAAQTLSCTVTASNAAGSGSATSGGVLIGDPAARHCPKPSGALRRLALGPLALGMTQRRARHTLRRFRVITAHFDDFCLFAGFGIRVAYGQQSLLASLPRQQQAKFRGKAVIALTANPFYALHGVRPGMRLSAVARRLGVGRPAHVGRNFWYFAPGRTATGVLKVRGGVIYEIGIATKSLTVGARAQLRFMLRLAPP